jgi:hypothetical protein
MRDSRSAPPPSLEAEREPAADAASWELPGPEPVDAADAAQPSDAMAPEPAPDAAHIDPAAPSWAPSLLGRFAVQGFTFYAEKNAVSTERIRTLIDVHVSDAGIELSEQTCEDYASSALATVKYAHPEKLPARRHRVQFQPDSFSTVPVDTAIGYEATPPPACDGKAGQRVAKRAFQTWFTGATCSCPGDMLPPIDDCRVIDADDDGLAGYTVLGNVAQLGTTEVYGVTLSLSKYVNGRPRASGGFVAQQERTVSSLQYGCRPAGCANLSGTSTTCGPAQSQIVFVPLAGRAEPTGGWSCASLLARAAELFPDLPPTTPSSCTQ